MNDDTTFTLQLAQRRKRSKYLMWAASGVIAIIVISLDEFREASSSTNTGAIVISLAIFGVIPVSALWLLRRSKQMRVVITPAEVVLYHLLSSETVPFDVIAGFEIDHRAGYPRPATLARLIPGTHGIPRSIPVPAMSAEPDRTGWEYGRHAARYIAEITPVIDAMNAELDRRRGAPLTAERLAAAHPAFRSIPYDD